MAETKIEWTDFTFNPWRGCEKVSDGCTNCYAETTSKRNPAVLGTWGPAGVRAIAAEPYWQLPLKWNAEAAAAGQRRRVFALSLGDWLEDRPELHAPRLRLLDLVRRTEYLDWLLLTKRIENFQSALARSADLAASVDGCGATVGLLSRWLMTDQPPSNVWVGVSVEDQQRADERIPRLLQTPAAIRFLSCEPLLGPVDLAKFLTAGGSDNPHQGSEHSRIDGEVPAAPVAAPQQQRPRWDKSIGDEQGDQEADRPAVRKLWVIVGPESGHHRRPADLDWIRSLRDQCVAARVPFFYKQEIVNGKKVSLPPLDGRQWSESPDAAY